MAFYACLTIQADNNFQPILNDDYVWYYTKVGYGSPDNCSQAKLWLEGDTIISGKMYKKCWSFGLDTVINPQVVALEAFMREENGKVWMLANTPPLSNLPRYLCYGDKSIETCIYDLNLNVGDSLYIRDFYMPYYKTLYIKSVGKETIHGVEHKYQIVTPCPETKLGDVKVIEGIGCSLDPERKYGPVSGYLPFPYMVNYYSSTYSFQECYLTKIENKVGDIIVDYFDLTSLSSVGEEKLEVFTENGKIVINGDYSTCSVIDINGRYVSSSQLSSGIYIVTVDGIPHKVLVR